MITVQGSRFPPNHPVIIHLEDAYHHVVEYQSETDGLGIFKENISVPGCSGVGNPLYVKATADSHTWSNTFTVHC
jgi:hypothetical protein